MLDSVFVSGLSVFGVAFVMSLTSTLINRKFIDREKAAKWQEEINKYKADKERAKKTNDKKLLAKLKRQEKRIMQEQTKMLKGQMLTMFTTMGLFFVVWQALIFFIGNRPVAYLPFSIPFVAEQNSQLQLFLWYMICSFFSSTIISRIFGVRMGMGMQPRTTE